MLKYKLLRTKSGNSGKTAVFNGKTKDKDFRFTEGVIENEEEYVDFVTSLRKEMIEEAETTDFYCCHLYDEEGNMLRSFDYETFKEEENPTSQPTITYEGMLNAMPIMDKDDVKTFLKAGLNV